MPADPAELRFFVDESALGLGKALAIARRDVVHTGHPLIPDAALGALDTEWMPVIAGRQLAVIARDKRIRTKPAELAMLREHGLRVFWIAGKRDLSTWDALVRVVGVGQRSSARLRTSGPAHGSAPSTITASPSSAFRSALDTEADPPPLWFVDNVCRRAP